MNYFTPNALLNNLKRKCLVYKVLLFTQYALMLEYRAEIALWVISGLLPLIMLSIWSQSYIITSIGWNNRMLVQYFLSAFIVRQFTAVWVMITFEQDNLEGKLSPFLLQPLTPFWRYFSSHIAEQMTRIPFVIFILFVFYLINPGLHLDFGIYSIVLGLISIFFAFLLRFLIHWIFAMVCFWSDRASAIERLLLIPYTFLSGLVAPLDIYPTAIRKFAYHTPYPYLVDFPSKVISGQNINISSGFTSISIWLFSLIVISIMAWKIGVKHYSGMGT